MKRVKEPQVYLVASTRLHPQNVRAYFDSIGLPEYELGGKSDGDNLVEMAGRLCYRSWAPHDESKPEATNPNVVRIRSGNHVYINHVLESGHGSVLEHCCASFVFKDVSRVLTHELVRHRAGMAYSQESLRYVRLSELRFRIPEIIDENGAARALFEEVVQYLEKKQLELAEIFGINESKDFVLKKGLTSAFRRIAPLGLSTSIMVTANLRAWRHVIEQRTSPGAEEEIRLVIGKAAKLLAIEFPSCFQDMSVDVDGVYHFSNHKV